MNLEPNSPIMTNHVPIPNYSLKRFINKPITGILHVGAHDCTEYKDYVDLGITKERIIWIDASKKWIDNGRNLGFNIFQGVISDIDNEEVTFNISSNDGASSSILDFGTHAIHHDYVTYTDSVKMKTITIPSLIKENNLNLDGYNFINLDIQGVELKALKGMIDLIPQFDYIYTEVNDEYVYKNCGLMSEIDEFLKEFNFKRVITHMTQWHWGDALYVKN